MPLVWFCNQPFLIKMPTLAQWMIATWWQIELSCSLPAAVAWKQKVLNDTDFKFLLSKIIQVTKIDNVPRKGFDTDIRFFC